MMSAWENEAVVQHYDWSTVHTIVDLGGHHGTLLSAIHAAHPHIHGYCLDRPQVLDRRESTPIPGVTFIAGDLFDASTIPREADVWLMKHIVFCDWDDEDSHCILRACHDAMPTNGRLIIGEAVLPEPSDCGRGNNLVYFHMDLLLLVAGREDSPKPAAAWHGAARRAGFWVEDIVYTGVPMCSLVILNKRED